MRLYTQSREPSHCWAAEHRAPWLAGWDERQDDVFAGPVGHRLAGQLGAVVAAQHGWVAAGQCEAVQFVDQGVGGDAALDQAGGALSGVLVDDRRQLDDPERAVTGLSAELSMPVDDLLAAPFPLVGSDGEILTAIRQRQQRWGINRLVIREDAIGKLAPLLPRLRETTE
jgi:hypothetical protein